MTVQGTEPAGTGASRTKDTLSVDFPDEDIAPDTRAALINRLANGAAFMAELLRTANEGQILITGRVPIATRGGLKARGHPVGATGMFQIV